MLWVFNFKIMIKRFFLIILVVLLLVAGQQIVLAAAAPILTLSGDDLLGNGGNDDAYDALVVLGITAAEASPDDWQLQYSSDAGDSWSDIIANYTEVSVQERLYYWSTAKIYAPTMLIRVRTLHGPDWSPYATASLSLSHRSTNHEAKYFVETFATTDYRDPTTTANWDTARSLVELSPNPPDYHPNDTAYSIDLLSGAANNDIFSVIFQPISWPFTDGKLEYQLSNNGTNWYGDTSGVPQPGGIGGTWFDFGDQTVPNPVTVPFSGSTGDQLFWRAKLSTSDNAVTPQIYQLRFQWSENTAPQACFSVSPSSSNDPAESFSFDATCSSDFEDQIGDLDYRWDFDYTGDSDSTWDTNWIQSGYSVNHIFNSTSTFDIRLSLRDSSGEESVEDWVQTINEPGIQDSLSGWLWSSNYGWTSLNCENTYYGTPYTFCPPNYGLNLNTNYTIDGWAWDANLGWLCFGVTCQAYGLTPDATQAEVTYSNASGQVTGWAKYLTFDQSGWLKLRGNWCGDPDQCVHVNLSRRALEGFGWAGGRDEGVAVGPGWVQFEGQFNVPWLETLFGVVYGRTNLGNDNTASAPEGSYNASYCIISGGSIVNLTSGTDCLETGYRDLDFPNVSNKYRTILGVIDFERILDGNEIEYDSADIDANLPSKLNGGVYHFIDQNDYYLDSAITFQNAQGLDSSGAGTVVVEGNLHINANLYYDSSSVQSQIENLASVAWIVKGDVIIDPTASSLAGNFIVLGKNGVACPAASCGNFQTGDDSSSPRQLVVGGLVMAKQFSFERFYKLNQRSAEKIIYDGRVVINTPPGLEDVAKGLPIWREAFANTDLE